MLLSWVLHTATYTEFERTRVTLVSDAVAPAEGTVRVDLPDTANLPATPTALIVRLRNQNTAPVHLSLSVKASEIARVVVPGSTTGRFNVLLPESAFVGSAGQLEISGAGGWALEYAEVANLYGFSGGVAAFVVLPGGSDEYLPPSRGVRWLVTLILLALGSIQRTGHDRRRHIHLTLVAVVVLFLGLVLFAPLATSYAIVLAFSTVVLCSGVVYFPAVIQTYRTLQERLSRNYLPDITSDDGSESAASHVSRVWSAPSRPLLLVAGAVIAVGLLAIVAHISTTEHSYTQSDSALLGIYTYLAQHGDLQLGFYSRMTWNHPGPLYFYVLAPLYWLTDQNQHSFAWTALLINLCSLSLLLSRLWNRGERGIFVTSLALLSLYLFRVEPLLTGAWPPHVAVLPLAALVVLCADFASTVQLGVLPLIVLLASFIVQTHLSFVPCVGALVLTSLILHVRFRRHHGSPRREARWWFVTAAVLVLAWAMPIAEELQGDPGNLTHLYQFFRSIGGERPSLWDALGAFAYYSSAVVMPHLELADGGGVAPGFAWPSGLVGAAQLVLLWPASRWAHARGRLFHRALCLVSLSGLVAALWSVTRITGDIVDHLVFLASIVGVIGLSAIVAVVTCQLWDYLQSRQLVPAQWRRRTWSRRVPVMVVLILVTYSLPRLAYNQRSAGLGSAAVMTLFGELRTYLDEHSMKRTLLGISQDSWATAAGIVLELSRDGRQVAVEPRWISMYTDAFEENGSEDGIFEIVDSPHDTLRFLLRYEPIATHDNVTIYRELALGEVQRLAPSGRIVETADTLGDPLKIVDGIVPADGTEWDAEGTLIFEGRDAFVTLDVPAGATGVSLSADGNDSWRLECSLDGLAFEPAGVILERQGGGLQTRGDHYRGLPACRQLRILPGSGDGLFSIGEVMFLRGSVNRAREGAS